jgi:hypothetical protein
MELGRSTQPAALRFVSFFAAFNSIYWLWFRATSSGRGRVTEREQIVQLLERLLAADLQQLNSTAVENAIRYFRDRDEGPVRDMNKRTNAEDEGADEHARAAHALLTKRLRNERLKGLAMVLYQVRCNLIHGSKKLFGTDATVLEHAAPAIECFADAALAYTNAAMAESRR